MTKAEHVTQHLGHSVYAVHTEGSRIRSVDAFEFATGGARRLKRPTAGS